MPKIRKKNLFKIKFLFYKKDTLFKNVLFNKKFTTFCSTLSLSKNLQKKVLFIFLLSEFFTRKIKAPDYKLLPKK